MLGRDNQGIQVGQGLADAAARYAAQGLLWLGGAHVVGFGHPASADPQPAVAVALSGFEHIEALPC